MSLFVANWLVGWDRHIQMQNVIEDDGITVRTDWMELTATLPCGDELIPIGFRWNGASVGPLRRFFPKWKHPIATCRHDARCAAALTVEERKFADREFFRDVGKGGTKWEQLKGYSAVRLGAYRAKLLGKLI